jgi:hypothetical protein
MVSPAKDAGSGPHDVDAAAVGFQEEIGAERAALRLEAFGSFPEAQEHLLDDFLGGVTVAEGSTGEGVGGSAVAAVDLRERVAVPPADGDDQGGVTHLGGHTGPHDVHSVAEGPRGSLRVEISRPGLVRYRASGRR